MICLEMCGPPEKGFDRPDRHRNNTHKGSPSDADDGLPPFPLKDKKHMPPIKVLT